MNPYALIPIAALFGNIVLWAGVYWQKRKTPLHRSYLNLSAAIGLILLGEVLLYVHPFDGWELLNFRLFTLIWVPLGCIFLVFVYRLLGRPNDKLIYAAVATSAAMAILGASTDLVIRDFTVYEWGPADLPGPLHIPAVTLSSAWATVGIALVGLRLLKARDHTERGTLILLLVGAIGSCSTAAAFEMVIPDILGIVDFPREAGTALAAFNFFVFLSYKRYDFLSLNVEQVAEELFHESVNGIVLARNDGKVKRMNPAAREMLDISTLSEAEETITHLIGPLALVDGFSPAEVEILRQGELRHVELSESVAARAGLDLVRIVLIRDVTPQKQAEALLRSSHNELEQQVAHRTSELRQAQKMQAVGTLAGGIAHDFNNYLAAIIGFSTAAHHDLAEDSPLRQDLDEVLNASRKARDLTQQILTFARRGDAQHRPVDVSVAVRDALRLVEVSLPPDTRLAITDQTESPWVQGDSTQLNQVVVNLCTNASQAIGERGGIIRVNVEITTIAAGDMDELIPLQPGQFARITVSDDGVGMTPQTLERIFEPYYTTKAPGKGTGLGLSTVFGIVESHHGHISVESVLGQGTKVKVLLPLYDGLAEQGPGSPLRETAGEPRTGEWILAVDDEEQIRRLIKRILEPAGYRVTTCEDGVKALEVVDRAPNRYSMVVTDLMMPEMTGFELAKRLRERRRAIPIVIISGREDRLVDDLPEDLAGVCCLSKPVTSDELLTAVREGLDGLSPGPTAAG